MARLILWFKLSKQFSHTDEDLFFGAVYFHTPDELENFEIEITNMCVSQKFVFLMSDFNSRTCNKQDYMYLDADSFFLWTAVTLMMYYVGFMMYRQC